MRHILTARDIPVVPAMFGNDRSAEVIEISDEDACSSASSALVRMEDPFRQQAEDE